jgi:DNA-binding NtrC family response regulator
MMAASSRPIRVLVVDDDVAVRDSLAAFFGDEGFAVRSAGTAGEALVEIGTGATDVAVVDVRLSGADGPSVIVRGHELAPGARFLIYTGSVGYRLPPALAAIGMTQADVVRKPAESMQLLVDAVRRVAGKESSRVGS